MALFNLFGKHKQKETTAASESDPNQNASQPESQPESQPGIQPDNLATADEAIVSAPIEPADKPAGGHFFARIRQGLARTRSQLGEGLASLFMGAKAIDDDLFEELETQLLMADIGVEATAAIMAEL
ncbi:MAG: signal recognition particle receptor subunit alpha, partial [Pseudomonadales bacterium]